MNEINTSVLKRANIDEINIMKTVQALNFDNSTKDASKIKLMEVDMEFLKTLAEEEKVSFRGEKGDQVVLCTKEKTYDVKLADMSNSILLVPNLKFFKHCNDENAEKNHVIEDKFIKGTYHQFYEIIECPPKLSKLATILEPSTFKGLEFEKLVRKEDLYDWERLISEVQASDEEIRLSFLDFMITNLDGYYRMVSFEFEARALTLMLDFVEENSWKPEEVDKKYTYNELSEFIPPAVFNLIFHKYAIPSGTSETGEQLYKYREDQCCNLLARVLLASCPVSDFKAFMNAWKLGTPEYMEPKPEYLHGTAIVVHNPVKKKNEVALFPEMNLSSNIDERFKELFKAKSKWILEEISPYLKKLCTKKNNVNALLTKYARFSVTNGQKLYSSKHDR